MSIQLVLQASEYQGPARWRWVLSAEDGRLIADHDVRLDYADWQTEAFHDLPGYLAWHAAPDRRVQDEAAIVSSLGNWIATKVLGPVGAAMIENRAATIRLVMPPEPETIRFLMFLPLELARVDGRAIGLSRINLVRDLGQPARAASPQRERVRVLGLFSLPQGGQVMNLRRERQALVRTSDKITAMGQAAEVRVLQYGVTRDRLRDVLEEDEGWDVIHVFGHSPPGELVLETSEGQPDHVTRAELAAMLDLARERVRLVTVSASWSGAQSGAETRRLLGLPAFADWSSERVLGTDFEIPDRAAAADESDDSTFKALLIRLTERLGCAVLAMRYPVTDDFATAFYSGLYQRLVGKDQPLPDALGLVLHEVSADMPTPAVPVLSLYSPVLLGAGAATLRLGAQRRFESFSYDTGVLKMAGFPSQPDRFVGRTAVMARASAALAAASGVPGVLLHGMPGAGKTSCALELAYTHEHAFDQLVWFKAPDEGQDITGALTDFAVTLERELPGIQMVHVVTDEARLAAFLPQLTALMEQRRVLIVIDNIESLLGAEGQWRDARWGQLTSALCGHAGRGRVILTSRFPPTGIGRGAGGAALLVAAVDALSLDETLLLARELPHLRGLIDGEMPGMNRVEARRLALGVLNAVQGHPKLLELADGQAGDRERLAALVQAADEAWRQAGGLPEGFFRTGESQAAAHDYLQVLAAWTHTATDRLAQGQRALFWFLCCLEEGDRVRGVLNANLVDLWRRLDLPGEPLDLDPAVTALADYGLIAVRREDGDASESYEISAGVAAAAHAESGQVFQDAVDAELAAYWYTLAREAQKREAEHGNTGLVVRAGLAAAPYLIRQGRWGAAASLLQDAFYRNPSRATAAAVLPQLQYINAAGQVPAAAGALAEVLAVIDPAAGERQMRAFMEDSVARADYQSASIAAGRLARQHATIGRLAEALVLTDQKAEYTRLAGLGPWTQLLDQVQRLQVLDAMGQSEQVLDEVQRLRAHMEALPPVPDRPEGVATWDVREELLATGRDAALRLGRWYNALDLNAAIVASERDRGAPETVIAQARFTDYVPLLRLGRTDDALDRLLECRRVFEGAHDIGSLGATLSALAEAEDARGHGQAGIGLERDALRYAYLAGDASAITSSHRDLGSYLRRSGFQPAAALAHHLAAALIGALAGAGGTEMSLSEAAIDLRALGVHAPVPSDVAELCDKVAEVPGVDLYRLLTSLAPDVDTIQSTLQALTARVRELATAPPPGVSRYLAAWDPVIGALLAAADGEQESATALDAELTRYADSTDWCKLVAALRRLRAGDTSQELLTGLDEIDTAIMTRALDARHGKVVIPAGLWPSMPIRWLLGDLVAAAGGYTEAIGPVRESLAEVAQDPDSAPLATVLTRILVGDREPDLTALTNPVQKAVAETVLQHIIPE